MWSGHANFLLSGYAGKTQIARYYDLNDINGDRMVLVVRYTWHGASWASSNACSSTILFYIDQYCTVSETSATGNVT
jgi:hypothetical protein